MTTKPDAIETSEVEMVETAGTDVEEAEVETPALPVGYNPLHIDITPARLAARVYQFGKGDYQVTDLDAKGIKTIALRLGISVPKSKFKETSDGKGYYFTAKAVNLVTEQEGTDHCFQSKNHLHGKRKGQFDEDALAKGATRVVRRARRQLIPEEIIDQAIEWAMIGENTPDAVGTAKKAASTARDIAKNKMKAMGINATLCYEDAQQQMGPAENWGASEWYALRDKYADPETEFAHLANQQKAQQAKEQAVKPEPVPEQTDRDKAIAEVQKQVDKVKQDAKISPLVLDENDLIYRTLIEQWFGAVKELDVGQMRDLAGILETIVGGDLSRLPQSQSASTAPQPDEVVPPPQTQTPRESAVLAFFTEIENVAKTPKASEKGWTEEHIYDALLQFYKVSTHNELTDEQLAEVIDGLNAHGIHFIMQLVEKHS